MIVGAVKESFPGERRVALVPAVLPILTKMGLECIVQAGSGIDAGFPDAAFAEKGAQIAPQRSDVFGVADILLQVRTLGANPSAGKSDLDLLRRDQILIGMCEPLTAMTESQAMAERGVTTFAMELIPRITRGQSMDVLSSMATIAGYKAVLLAADALPRMFPMLTTAAGTIAAARVLIIGAGVAGLQAIATARRLGAVVSGYDVRAAVKEQVQSLGAKFVELAIESAEGQGGYARQMDEAYYKRQRELLTEVIRQQDVVITTAAVPGKKAPILLTRDMVHAMAPGSVVVDIAAERGGNCELTKPGETTVENGVRVIGPLNLPATIPYHASQMYSKNLVTFLKLLVAKDGKLNIDTKDEIIRETLLTRGGEIVHPKVREIAGLPSANTPVLAGAGA